MIISRSYANKLVRDGKARKNNCVYCTEGRRWQRVERFDVNRVDHYELHQGQMGILQVRRQGEPSLMHILTVKADPKSL